MTTDDQQPFTRGEARRAGLLPPETGPAYRNPGARVLDAYFERYAAAVANLPPGATYEPLGPPGVIGTMTSTVPADRTRRENLLLPGVSDPPPATVISEAPFISRVFDGNEVSVEDLASSDKPLAELIDEGTGQLSPPPPGRRPFRRRQETTTTPEVH